MKKKIVGTMLVVFMAWGTCAFAGDVSDPHYQEMKKLKEQQRTERLANKKNPQPENKSGFWHKEGERSGLGGSGNRMGNFVKSMNPAPFFKNQQEKYNARKAASSGK